jgi:hypothetical protein
MDQSDRTFIPFDGFDKKEFKFKLKRTTNKTVCQMYSVCSEFEQFPMNTRISFARKAGKRPEIVTIEENGTEAKREKWELNNTYPTTGLFYAALGYAILEDFPKLYEIDSNGSAIESDENAEPGLNDLILSEIKDAFFLLKTKFEMI